MWNISLSLDVFAILLPDDSVVFSNHYQLECTYGKKKKTRRISPAGLDLPMLRLLNREKTNAARLTLTSGPGPGPTQALTRPNAHGLDLGITGASSRSAVFLRFAGQRSGGWCVSSLLQRNYARRRRSKMNFVHALFQSISADIEAS
jgi:hypothetical protein